MASAAKNTLFMTLASIGQKVIAFAYFTLIAREIGASGTGKYFFALSFTTVFVVFVDLGLTNVFVREAAKAKEKLTDYLGTILSIKMVLGLLSYVAVFLVINLMGYDIETKHMVYLSGLTMLFDSLHLTLYGSLRALGKLKYEAIGIVGTQLLTLVLGTTFLFLHLPLVFLILAFTIPSAMNVLYVIFVLTKKYQLSLKPHYRRNTARMLIKIAVPFALAAVFARVYSYIDSILLSKMLGDTAVGLYSIPYKITYAFQFIPLALVAAIYPRFSEYFVSDRKKLADMFVRGMKYLLLIAVPIAVGIGVLAKDIILTLYTAEYLPSVLPLQILIGSLIFSYLSFPVGAFLNACDRQKTQTAIVGIVMLLNICLNILLIPQYGIVGSAIAALLGNVLLTLFGYCIVPQITHVPHRMLFFSMIKIVCAALIMGGAVYVASLYVHFIVAILVGGLVYPLGLLAVRGITTQELKEAYAIIRK